jgi:hypothetical protein
MAHVPLPAGPPPIHALARLSLPVRNMAWPGPRVGPGPARINRRFRQASMEPVMNMKPAHFFLKFTIHYACFVFLS